MTKTEAAVVYVRVSTEEQVAGGVSLDAQEDRARAYCAAVNLQVATLLREEGVSAKINLAKRPQGRRISETLKHHRARHIVVLKLDRLFRSVTDALNTVDRWEKTGIGLHIIDMGGQSISTATAMGKFWLTMLAGLAEFERGLISERTRAAMAFKRVKGEFVGNVPYGFRLDGKQLVIDDEECAVVRVIQQLRAGGNTLQAIADELIRRGIPTKTGRRWHPSTVRYILRNTALHGVYEHPEQETLPTK